MNKNNPYDGINIEYERELIRRITELVGKKRLSGQVGGILKRMVNDISQVIAKESPTAFLNSVGSKKLQWNSYKLKRIDDMITLMHDNLVTTIEDAMASTWGLANDKNNEIVGRYISGKNVSALMQAQFSSLNIDAMRAFISRTENGMGLSDRIWKMTDTLKEDLEQYLSTGITSGQSAITTSKNLGKYLEGKPIPYKGTLIKGRNLEFNAIRLAATETNMAFRRSDIARRAELPFITGVRVNLSDSHPREDICDSMMGLYPPNFEFVGWHPVCICYTTTEMLSDDQFKRYLQTGDVPDGAYRTRIPARAEGYVEKHLDQIQGWKSKPYWFKDNFDSDGSLKNVIVKR